MLYLLQTTTGDVLLNLSSPPVYVKFDDVYEFNDEPAYDTAGNITNLKGEITKVNITMVFPHCEPLKFTLDVEISNLFKRDMDKRFYEVPTTANKPYIS